MAEWQNVCMAECVYVRMAECVYGGMAECVYGGMTECVCQNDSLCTTNTLITCVHLQNERSVTMISLRAGTASASNPRMCVMDSVTAVTAQTRRWIGVTLAAVSLKYSI